MSPRTTNGVWTMLPICPRTMSTSLQPASLTPGRPQERAPGTTARQPSRRARPPACKQVGRLLRSLCKCRGYKSKKGNAVADTESDCITDKQTEDI